MNNSTTNTPILEDDAITEIEARPYIVVGWGRRIELRPEERDALCATVRALRAENERLKERNKTINRQLVSIRGQCK